MRTYEQLAAAHNLPNLTVDQLELIYNTEHRRARAATPGSAAVRRAVNRSARVSKELLRRGFGLAPSYVAGEFCAYKLKEVA